MSNQYIPDPDSKPSGNGNSYNSRREMRVSNSTGALPAVSVGRSYSGSFDFEGLISSLRELFAKDRQIASQQDGTRCGICYLYFTATELHYREEEGFYVCPSCERALGKQTLPMVRRQQK